MGLESQVIFGIHGEEAAASSILPAVDPSTRVDFFFSGTSP